MDFCYKCESPVSLCICDESITDEDEYHAWCKARIAELEKACYFRERLYDFESNARNELKKETDRLREAVRHFLETISLAQRDIMAEKDALEKMAALLEGE